MPEVPAQVLELVKESLEKQGLFHKIKAELRASVLNVLLKQKPREEPLLFDRFSEAEDDHQKAIGTLALLLLKDALEAFQLKFTLSVFMQETGMDSISMEREELAQHLGVSVQSDDCVLFSLLSERLTEPAEEELGDDTSPEHYSTPPTEPITFSITATNNKSLEGFLPSQIELPDDSSEYMDNNDGDNTKDYGGNEYEEEAQDDHDEAEKAPDELAEMETPVVRPWNISAFGRQLEESDGDDPKVGLSNPRVGLSKSTPSLKVSEEVPIRKDFGATSNFTQRVRLSREDQIALEQALADEPEEVAVKPAPRVREPITRKDSVNTAQAGKGFISANEYLMTQRGGQPPERADDDEFGDVRDTSSPRTSSSRMWGAPAPANTNRASKWKAEDDDDDFGDLDEPALPAIKSKAYAPDDKYSLDSQPSLVKNTSPRAAAKAIYTDDVVTGAAEGGDEFQDMDSVGGGSNDSFAEEEERMGASALVGQRRPLMDQSKPPMTDAFAEGKATPSLSTKPTEVQPKTISASQSNDNYDEDFEVEVEDEEVVSAVSEEAGNLFAEDDENNLEFSVDARSDHQDDSDF